MRNLATFACASDAAGAREHARARLRRRRGDSRTGRSRRRILADAAVLEDQAVCALPPGTGRKWQCCSCASGAPLWRRVARRPYRWGQMTLSKRAPPVGRECRPARLRQHRLRCSRKAQFPALLLSVAALATVAFKQCVLFETSKALHSEHCSRAASATANQATEPAAIASTVGIKTMYTIAAAALLAQPRAAALEEAAAASPPGQQPPRTTTVVPSSVATTG